MFVHYQYGSYPVTEQRIRPTHYTNTHTGDVLNDPARDLPETRREYQREPNGMFHCVQQVLHEVNEEVRPQLRDGRNEERPSFMEPRSLSMAHRPREAVKVTNHCGSDDRHCRPLHC